MNVLGDENITFGKMLLMAHKSNQWLGASVRTYKNYILVSYSISQTALVHRIDLSILFCCCCCCCWVFSTEKPYTFKFETVCYNWS